jgi:low affinity Fe/Cu permease
MFNKFSRWVSNLAGRPITFFVAFLIIFSWALSGPLFHFCDTWQLAINTGTTIVTFLMVFVIQNSQNRDSAAVQLKLNELIRAVEGAHNRLISLENASQEELDELKVGYAKLAKTVDRENDTACRDLEMTPMDTTA